MKHINLDKSLVKQVSNASKTATGAMIILALRKRSHSVTTLDSVKNQMYEMGEIPAQRDFMDFWRGLEKAGAGSVILGRRGKPTRFEWNYSLKDVAQIGVNVREEELAKIEPKKLLAPKAKLEKPSVFRNAINFPKDARIKAVPSLQDVRNTLLMPTIGEKKSEKKVSPTKQEVLIYRIEVRPEFVTEIMLPSDVSEKELESVRNSFRSFKEEAAI